MRNQKEIENWITINHKHIPIYKGESAQDAFNRAIAKDNEDRKQRDIKRNKEQADKLNNKSSSIGMSIDKVMFNENALDENGNLKGGWKAISKNQHKREQEYVQSLIDAGVFDNANIPKEDLKGEYLVDSVLADWGGFNTESYVTKDNKLIQGLAKWELGASSGGYGVGANSRERFDKKYGISDFIDTHENVQLNTNKSLYRGVKSTESDIQSLRVAFKNGDFISMNGPSSWSSSNEMAKRFASDSLVEPENYKKVIFVDTTKGLRKAMPYPISEQAEVISSGSSRYKILNIESKSHINNYGQTEEIIYVTVKQ